jgi:hypothetical protein
MPDKEVGVLISTGQIGSTWRDTDGADARCVEFVLNGECRGEGHKVGGLRELRDQS